MKFVDGFGMPVRIRVRAMEKSRPDRVTGGLADKKEPGDFDPKALAKGIKVELEHTNDRELAREIAMDHLVENPHYYDMLAKMEAKMEKATKHGKTPAEEAKWHEIFEALKRDGHSEESAAKIAWHQIKAMRKAEQLGMFGAQPIKVKAHVSRSKSGKLTQVRSHQRNASKHRAAVESGKAAIRDAIYPSVTTQKKVAFHNNMARGHDSAVRAGRRESEGSSQWHSEEAARHHEEAAKEFKAAASIAPTEKERKHATELHEQAKASAAEHRAKQAKLKGPDPAEEARKEMGHTAKDEDRAHKLLARMVKLESMDEGAAYHGGTYRGSGSDMREAGRSRASIRKELDQVYNDFDALPKTAQNVAHHGHEQALEYHRKDKAREAKAKASTVSPGGRVEGITLAELRGGQGDHKAPASSASSADIKAKADEAFKKLRHDPSTRDRAQAAWEEGYKASQRGEPLDEAGARAKWGRSARFHSAGRYAHMNDAGKIGGMYKARLVIARWLRKAIPAGMAAGGGAMPAAGGAGAPGGGQGPIKGKSGLVLRPSKALGGAKRWQKVGADQPAAPKAPGQQQPPQAQQPAAPQGEHVGRAVQFRHPETGDIHHGKVVASGHMGSTIESGGQLHQVRHGHYIEPDGGGEAGAMGGGATPEQKLQKQIQETEGRRQVYQERAKEPRPTEPPPQPYSEAQQGGGKGRPLHEHPDIEEGSKRHWVPSLDHLPADTEKAYQGADKLYMESYTDPGGARGMKQDGSKEPVEFKAGQRPRADLHIDIMRTFLDHVPSQPKGKQEAIVMLGGTAAGKSTSIRKVFGDISKSHVNVNPDDIKEFLPEYAEAVGAGQHPETNKPISAKNAAGLSHEESSTLSKVIQQQAIHDNKNVLLDGTGADVDKMHAILDHLKSKGYKTKLLFVDIDKDEALKRMRNRAEGSGRHVPEKFFHHAHNLIPSNFHELAAKADSATMMNNDNKGGEGAVKVWSREEGQKDGTTHSQEHYDAFKQREAPSRARRFGKGRRFAEGTGPRGLPGQGQRVPDRGERGGRREAPSSLREPPQRLERTGRTRLPGVYTVRMSKASVEGLRHADEILQYRGTELTVPEVVPGTMLKGLDGEVIRGIFKVGPYHMEYRKAARKPAVLSISSTGMAVPFHMIVRDWNDAMQKGQAAAEAFNRGEVAPEEGVFRHVGSRVGVPWPGTH